MVDLLIMMRSQCSAKITVAYVDKLHIMKVASSQIIVPN